MSYFRNAFNKLYDIVSAPVAATRDALADKLQSVRETASLLYNKAKEKLGFSNILKHVPKPEEETKIESQSCRRCRLVLPLSAFRMYQAGKIRKRATACYRCYCYEEEGKERRARGEVKDSWMWNGHRIYRKGHYRATGYWYKRCDKCNSVRIMKEKEKFCSQCQKRWDMRFENALVQPQYCHPGWR